MAQNRAQKSGFAREAQEKMNSKWDDEVAQEAIHWVGARIGQQDLLDYKGGLDNAYELFKDGFYLAKLANWVRPGAVAASKLNKPPGPAFAFKRMELIELFLKAINKQHGGMVDDASICSVPDIYEKVNMVQFITCLEALGRAMQSAGREGFGKMESEKNVRQFTDEQMKAGQNVIGLQMGSNKGASQAGQNFGKSRMIVD